MVDQSYYKKADEIIEHYERCAASLIPIMQDIQAEYRYLPAELLTYVAGQIGVTEAKAFSVATFYENFSFEPKGKYIIKTENTFPHSSPLIFLIKLDFPAPGWPPKTKPLGNASGLI